MKTSTHRQCLFVSLAVAGLAFGCGSEFTTSTDTFGQGGRGQDSAVSDGAGTGGSAGTGGGGGTAGGGGSISDSGTGGKGGGSGGTAGSGGIGGTAGAAGVAGAAGGPPEDCLNGMDDNGDGRADCDDPTCQANFQCVVAPPPGWVGLGWLRTDTSRCSLGYPGSRALFNNEDLRPLPPKCECRCGSPQGETCASPTHTYAASACSTPGSTIYVPPTCAKVPTSSGGSPLIYARAFAPSPMYGSCGPAVATASPPPAIDWPWRVQLCYRDRGGSCGPKPEMACVPKPEGMTTSCIMYPGIADCPGSPYPYSVRSVYYDGKVADTRGCADAAGCSCSAVSGASCTCPATGCSMDFYGVDGCTNTNPIANIPTDGRCIQIVNGSVPAAMSAKLNGATLTAVGACSPQGAPTPTGGVTPLDPITVCCTP